MTTIKQIAEELGVSPTTVSNVINGRTGKCPWKPGGKSKKRSGKTIMRQQESSSASSGENMIAVGFCMGGYCNVLTDPFCGELLGAIQKAAKEQGRYIVYDVPETEEDILRLCAPWNIDGAIVLGWKPEECARLAKKTGKPMVFIDSCFADSEEYDNIGLQDYEGAFELTSYLLRLGHRSIAFSVIRNSLWQATVNVCAAFRTHCWALACLFAGMIFIIFLKTKQCATRCCGSS